MKRKTSRNIFFFWTILENLVCPLEIAPFRTGKWKAPVPDPINDYTCGYEDHNLDALKFLPAMENFKCLQNGELVRQSKNCRLAIQRSNVDLRLWQNAKTSVLNHFEGFLYGCCINDDLKVVADGLTPPSPLNKKRLRMSLFLFQLRTPHMSRWSSSYPLRIEEHPIH